MTRYLDLNCTNDSGSIGPFVLSSSYSVRVIKSCKSREVHWLVLLVHPDIPTLYHPLHTDVYQSTLTSKSPAESLTLPPRTVPLHQLSCHWKHCQRFLLPQIRPLSLVKHYHHRTLLHSRLSVEKHLRIASPIQLLGAGKRWWPKH